MAVSREQLILDVLANTSKAGSDLTQFGRKVGAASDDVSALAKRLDDLSAKSAKARVSLEGDKDAQAKLDKLDLKLATLGNKTARPDVTVEGAARAAVEIAALDVELDHLSDKSANVSSGFSLLSNTAGLTTAGLGALVGVAVVLSPVIATLGVGLGGLGLAALAAGKHSKELAAEMAPLKADFAAFGNELQPVVLQDFAKAAEVARGVLHDIEPVTVATGKALGGMLDAIDAELKSGTWQGFFQFVASTAGPDIKLLTDNFVGLLHVLPPLLESLQPLATTLLKDTAGLLHLVDATEKAVAAEHRLGQEASSNTGWFGRLAHAAGDAFKELVPGGVGIKHVADEFGKLSSNTGDASHQQAVIAVTFGHSGDAAIIAASKVQSLADAVQHLNTQLSNSIKPNATFNTDLINVRDSAKQAADALDKTHDKIGLNTAAQRNAFQYQQAYINNLVQLTQDAGKNRQKQDEATDAIRRALPQLEHVKGGTREYWQEVRSLIAWLERERRERNIHKVVSISGAATWSLSNPGGKLAGPQAAGGMINVGTTSTADDVIARVSKGEVIVPAHMVQAGAVDHLRGKLPRFAQGGIVPSYSGNVAGLVPWGQHNVAATNTWLINTMASALARSFTAIGMPSGHNAIGGGVQQWAPLVLRVLAMLGQPAGDLGTVLSQMTTESGGNQFAINLWDSNAKAGHPSQGLMQVIPGTFAAYAGPFLSRGIFDPLANIYAGLNYAIHRYGAAWTEVLGHGHGYDQGGYLPPGLSLAYNGTGRPERVGGGNTYNITVNVSPSANQAEVGRVTVQAIKEFERRSGNSWRK